MVVLSVEYTSHAVMMVGSSEHGPITMRLGRRENAKGETLVANQIVTKISMQIRFIIIPFSIECSSPVMTVARDAPPGFAIVSEADMWIETARSE